MIVYIRNIKYPIILAKDPKIGLLPLLVNPYLLPRPGPLGGTCSVVNTVQGPRSARNGPLLTTDGRSLHMRNRPDDTPCLGLS
jgi:hypothetical protein